MKRILFISHIDDKGKSGGSTHTKNAIKLLSKTYNIDVFYILKNNQFKPLRKVLSILGSYIFKIPSKLLYYFNIISITKFLFIQWKYDEICFDHLESTILLYFKLKKINITYISHNNESKLFLQNIKHSISNHILRAALFYDFKRYRKHEKNIISKSNQIISISKADIPSGLVKSKILILPPIFSYEPFKYNKSNIKTTINIGFLGDMFWWPNKESVYFIINEIYPKINKNIALHFFGKHPPIFKQFQNNSIIFHGFVDDIQEVWRTCDFMLYPIKHGSGVNIKVAEAIYNNIPIIGSKTAFRGIDLPETYKEYYICNTKTEYIDLINKLSNQIIRN